VNGIIVLNLRDFMPQQARRSICLAAERWEAGYQEITFPLADIHHFWQKTLIPTSHYAAPYDRVLVLDGDILIGSDCHNLFAIVPETHFGVVSRHQPHHPVAYVGRRESRLFGVPAYPDESKHLNGGLILYHRTLHANVLRRWKEAGEYCQFRNVGRADQGALSCVLHQMRTPVTWLPWQYNALHSQRLRRPAYVYHFNQRGRHSVAELMAACKQENIP